MHCDSVYTFLADLQLAVAMCEPFLPAGDPDTVASLQRYLSKLVNNIHQYIAHLVRKQHEKGAEQKMVDMLDDDTIYCVVDWKMKLYELVYRQAQPEYFGQRGIAWFGCMVYRKKVPQEIEHDAERGNDTRATTYKTNFIDLTSDDGTEHAFASAAMFQVVLQQYVKSSPWVKKIMVKSDGAACFMGVEFFRALPLLCAAAGLRIVLLVRSEVGLGKSPLDGHFGNVGPH